jgi:DNA-binding transcriptional LysR family regulator
VSKYVSQLEDHLGVRLLNRTTRKVHLTEAGVKCVQYARDILERMNDLEGDLGQLISEAQGLLHISAPVSFASKHLARLLQDFKTAHPAVSINLQVSDRKVELVEEGFDVALRIGKLKSSSLVAKYIAPIKLVMCAAPSYLAKHGTPMHPSELIPEHYLRYSYLEHSQTKSPLMDALQKAVRANSAGAESNNGDLLAGMAIEGSGYALQPTFMVGKAIKEGRLVVILKEHTPEPLALYAVYPHRKLLATKLRVFIDFLSQYYGQTPYWDEFE